MGAFDYNSGHTISLVRHDQLDFLLHVFGLFSNMRTKRKKKYLVWITSHSLTGSTSTTPSDQNTSLIPLYMNGSKKNTTTSMSVFPFTTYKCFLLAAKRHWKTVEFENVHETLLELLSLISFQMTKCALHPYQDFFFYAEYMLWRKHAWTVLI